MSALRQTASPATPDGGAIPGDVHGALEELDVPAYAVDKFGVIRWINSAAQELVGDIRGRQQSSLVVPEQAREAKESFLRKMMGTERSTEATVVVVEPGGQRVQVEISSCPLREGGRIVGVFGVVKHREETAAPSPHPHLTPRQNQVLHLLARGHSTTQIAQELHLSRETVRNHVRLMMRALDAHSRIEALAVAHREGILRRDN
ncbi:MAG TPA: LuxR C-terminal-related transcriptional regulator [Gaiellaceae bacterium]|jgi:PAS domain S-box-containing protein|nr:LuxR C-terminal-related transcriptional regulator [Gaiellaceae bacterium]